MSHLDVCENATDRLGGEGKPWYLLSSTLIDGMDGDSRGGDELDLENKAAGQGCRTTMDRQ